MAQPTPETEIATGARGLRVLHVLPYFRPAYAFGGPAIGTDMLTSGLADAGCLVTVWTSNVLDAKGAKLKAGREGNNPLVVRRYRYFFGFLFRLTGVLMTPGMVLDAVAGARESDIVHLHDYRSVQAICAFLYARRFGVPLLLHPHGTLKIVLGKETLKRLYDRLVGNKLLAQASRVIVLSDAEADEARHAGVTETKIVVVPNGVRIPSLRESEFSGKFRKKHRIRDDWFLILFLGRIRKSKGVLLLLDAFSKFNQDCPESALAICGPDDGAEAELRRAVVRLGAPVILPGLLTGTEKAEALNDSDAFCLPSLVETQSVAVLEAASYGLPIIAGKSSVPGDFIEKEAGVFVDIDRDSLADAFRRVARSPHLQATCGLNARALVERRYSINSQVSAILDVYSDVSRGRHIAEKATVGR